MCVPPHSMGSGAGSPSTLKRAVVFGSVCATEQSFQFLEVALRMRQKISFPTLPLLAYGPCKMYHVRWPKMCQRYGILTIGHIQLLGFRSIDLAVAEVLHQNFFVAHCNETLQDIAHMTLLHSCQLQK